MSNDEEARRQAQRDAEQNKGPAQTHGWNHSDRVNYEAEYNRQRDKK